MRDLRSPLDGLRSPFGASRGPTGPTNTVAPVVSGTPTVGQTTSSTTGTWTGVGTITYAYQWLDDGAAISGATSSTYTLTAGEEGGFITCRVTATDDNGSTAATSNSVGPVAAATGAPLSLDFANDTYSDGTNTAFGDIFTFSRSGSATYIDSSGVIQTAATGVARRNHHEWNGSSWVNKGLLLETDSATNLLHTTNALVTQSLSVTAQPYTLHFTGTGTVTLSGASTAGPLVGTGTGENNRVSLTFTPSASTLTLTVSGTVTNAQLEAGNYRSSYIPNTAGSGTVTRASEAIEVKAASVPWSTTAWSIVFKGEASWIDSGATATVGICGAYVDANQAYRCRLTSAGPTTGQASTLIENSGTIETAFANDLTPGYRQSIRYGNRVTTTDLQDVLNGTAGPNQTAVGGTLGDFSAQAMLLGNEGLAAAYNGTIASFEMWDSDIGQSELETETA